MWVPLLVEFVQKGNWRWKKTVWTMWRATLRVGKGSSLFFALERASVGRGQWEYSEHHWLWRERSLFWPKPIIRKKRDPGYSSGANLIYCNLFPSIIACKREESGNEFKEVYHSMHFTLFFPSTMMVHAQVYCFYQKSACRALFFYPLSWEKRDCNGVLRVCEAPIAKQ